MGKIFDAYLDALRLHDFIRRNPSSRELVLSAIRREAISVSGIANPYAHRFPPSLVMDLEPFRYSFISPAVHLVHGYSVMDLIRDPLLALEYMIDRDAYFDALDTGRYHTPQTWRIRGKDGEIRKFREYRIDGVAKRRIQLIFEPVHSRYWQVRTGSSCVWWWQCRVRDRCGGPLRWVRAAA